MTKIKSRQKKPFFSIIIPTLNEENYLPQLLNSLYQQTYKEYEIFVVDANSEDKTRQVVKLWQKKLTKLKLLCTNKRSVSFQRNFGAKHAQGKYLIFMDADISFDKNILACTYRFTQEEKIILAFPSFYFKKRGVKYKIINIFGYILFNFLNHFNKNLVIGQFLIIKKGVFKKIKGYNTRLALAEEHDLLKRVRQKYSNIVFIKNISIQVSPRRIEKEGLIKLLLKYLYFVFYEHLKGPIYKTPLDYKMGGHHYD